MNTKSFLSFFFLLLINVIHVSAGDITAEYKITGIGDKISTNKLYFKNGDLRSEMKMEISGKELTSTTLNLKNDTDFIIAYNSFSKTYTEVKKKKDYPKAKNLTITVVGSDTVGAYNCKHVRLTSDTTSWDMWVTKDLPFFNFPIEKNNEAANFKILELLKSKGADGVMVKTVFFKPGTSVPTTTMQLTKFEEKTLDASLFQIPPGYTKSTVKMDPDKMKSMTPEERREMIKKMIQENAPQK